MTFQPPTIEMVDAYVKLRGLSVNPVKFLMHYEDSEPPWTNNGKLVKNWKLTAQSWHFNNLSRADTRPCSRCKNYGVYFAGKDDTGQAIWRCIGHKPKPKPLPKELVPDMKKVESNTVNFNNERNKQMTKLAKKVHGN